MICVSIMARDNPEALEKMARAAALADVIEIRLDVMECFDLNALISGATRPLIITHRSRREGGKGTATHALRARHLLKAMEAGAHFVDVELSMPLDHRQQILRNRSKTKVIVSSHIRNGTPPFPELEERLRKAAATGADVVKIVTTGQTHGGQPGGAAVDSTGPGHGSEDHRLLHGTAREDQQDRISTPRRIPDLCLSGRK